MSRIEEYEPDDTASFLRCCAFSGNVRRAVAGKKGRKFLLELEAALLALPEKRLSKGAMAAAREDFETYPPKPPVATGEVCALGAVAVARALAAGKDRMKVLQGLSEKFDPEESGWELTKMAAKELDICHPLAWAVVYRNDECSAQTDEERYEKVLEWVRAKLKGEAEL